MKHHFFLEKISYKVLIPACDSAPGLEPKPPSKFKQDLTKSAALSICSSDNLPRKLIENLNVLI